MLKRQMKSVRLEGDNCSLKRHELRDYFHQSFDLFESLFELLKNDEVFYRQSEPTRHPMIFYFGHTAVFYINKLLLCGAIKERINPRFESLFAVGVDEMSWDEESSRFEWPDVDAVRHYRNEVRRCVDTVIMTMPMHLPVRQNDPFWALWMGIEHERIHIETSSVLHRQMPIELVEAHKNFPMCPDTATAPVNELVSFEGGKVSMGKGDSDHGLYGWDNEYGYQTVNIERFEASIYLVSNAEYMEFVKDGGYAEKKWWDEEGLKYLQIRKASCPPFWIPQGEGTYRYRALAQEIDMPLNWPVEVNALEADAFCRWKSEKEGSSYRLPTEAEWIYMSRESGMDDDIFDDAKSNLNLAHYASSVPVNTFQHGRLYDIVGNVWQWTSTPIEGYDGFAPHDWYDDFSTPTFDAKHNLMKGGSWISTGNEIVATSRYAFRRHFIQHAGFRYVRSDKVVQAQTGKTIMDKELIELCTFDFETGVGVIEKALSVLRENNMPNESMMEIGCGGGGLTIRASNDFSKVVGIDISARIIGIGSTLLEYGLIYYGNEHREVSLASLQVPMARERVEFYQNDYYNLKPHFKGYSSIIVNNLHRSLILMRLEWEDILNRLNPNGKLAIIAAHEEIESFRWKNSKKIVLNEVFAVLIRDLHGE